MAKVFETLDERFNNLFVGTAQLDKLYTGCRWAEGPAYFAAGRYLVWSDIPNDRMLRYDETSGQTSVFRQPCRQHQRPHRRSPGPPGLLRAWRPPGRRAPSSTARSSRSPTAYKGKRLNSPNDVVVKSDGTIWFTDPSYGIDSDYEGNKSKSEIGRSNVYRIDPKSGAVMPSSPTTSCSPNGIAFSPDEKELYIVDTGATHKKNGPKHIRRFERQRRQAEGQGRVREMHRRPVRRLPLRHRRPDLDQRRRRRALLRDGRHADRQGPGAGGGGQRLLRRAEAELPLYLRHHLALRRAPQGQRRQKTF